MEQVYSKGARYYDMLYAGKDYAGEIQRLIPLLDIDPDPKSFALLDIACGTGLHIEYLKEHFRVEGLDICSELLDIARERHPDVEFHLGDMTNFTLGRQYDVITCLFSSIGYAKTLNKLDDTLRNMVEHLKPQGLLVIEPWFTPENWHPNTVHGIYIDEPRLKIARINTSFVEDGISIFDLHHLIGTPEGTEYIVEHHEMGLFETSEMTALMEAAGLSVSYSSEGLTGRGLFICRKMG